MRFEFASLTLLASLLVAHAVPIAHDEIVSKTADGLHLLSLAEDEDPVWKTEDEKLELLRQGVQFVRFPIRFPCISRSNLHIQVRRDLYVRTRTRVAQQGQTRCDRVQVIFHVNLWYA